MILRSQRALRCITQVHVIATLMMAGLIWLIQLVSYPLMAKTGDASFVAYHAEHMRRITWVVGPLMLIEAGTAIALLWLLRDRRAKRHAIAGTVLLAVIWLSTAFVQVPCHDRLTHGFDAATIARLIDTNWIRTIAWSIRGLLAVKIAAVAGNVANRLRTSLIVG